MEVSSDTSTEKNQSRLKDLFKIRWDSSILFLIATNLATIILAINQKWDFGTILLIYWCQSMIIGLFNFIKILNLKNFTIENAEVTGKVAKPTTKVGMGLFFLAHYGIFHVAYLGFIVLEARPEFILQSFMTLSIGLFFVNHLFSFIKNFKHDTEKKQDINKVMSFPYARIIPMHLTIIFGFLLRTNEGIIFFLILKTIVDVMMHNREHRD